MTIPHQENGRGKLTPALARAALCCVLGCGLTMPIAVQAESGSGSGSGSGSNSGSGFNSGLVPDLDPARAWQWKGDASFSR